MQGISNQDQNLEKFPRSCAVQATGNNLVCKGAHICVDAQESIGAVVDDRGDGGNLIHSDPQRVAYRPPPIQVAWLQPKPLVPAAGTQRLRAGHHQIFFINILQGTAVFATPSPAT